MVKCTINGISEFIKYVKIVYPIFCSTKTTEGEVWASRVDKRNQNNLVSEFSRDPRERVNFSIDNPLDRVCQKTVTWILHSSEYCAILLYYLSFFSQLSGLFFIC